MNSIIIPHNMGGGNYLPLSGGQLNGKLNMTQHIIDGIGNQGIYIVDNRIGCETGSYTIHGLQTINNSYNGSYAVNLDMLREAIIGKSVTFEVSIKYQTSYGSSFSSISGCYTTNVVKDKFFSTQISSGCLCIGSLASEVFDINFMIKPKSQVINLNELSQVMCIYSENPQINVLVPCNSWNIDQNNGALIYYFSSSYSKNLSDVLTIQFNM